MARTGIKKNLICLLLGLGSGMITAGQNTLDDGWNNPPIEARLRAYWWWLNGNVTKESITHDLEEMKAKGFGGAVIIDAGGAEQRGNAQVPHGPTFFTPEWRELYKYALREAHRLGLEMSLNIQSGWNLGGPVVGADDAAKKLTWSELVLTGSTNFNATLPLPQSRDNYYRDLFVLAYRIRDGQAPHRPLENWAEKALYKTLPSASAPSSKPLFQEFPSTPNEEDALSTCVMDLTSKLDAKGTLHWQVPAGQWRIIRFGCTISEHSYVSTYSEGWNGYALDVFDAAAFTRYWNAIVEPLIRDAGPLAGKTLKYLHTDSWEIESANWTPTIRDEFKKRRGYDLLPFFPVLAGRIVDSREISDRFLADYRKTLGDLAIDHHYRLFRDYAHRHGMEIHPESGGPHGVPIDAQRCLGWDDAPMSEFWAWSWEHRIGDDNRYFIKQPASAAHTYGRRLVLGEGFTTIGPHWQSHIWDNLKTSFDEAVCQGLNLLVWHAFVCSPDSTGVPGQQYFAGTHFNPKETWWNFSAPFLGYINRCQFLMQQGVFAADVCYYYGDHVPNFAQLKSSDPAHILPGYDYDVITEEALLARMSVRNRQIILPEGTTYRVLVLADLKSISPPTLSKIKELTASGATIIGSRPEQSSGLTGYPRSDADVKKIAGQLWGNCDGVKIREHDFGKGRVIAGETARQVLLADGIQPDFAVSGASTNAQFDYIHRRAGAAEIYFVINRAPHPESVHCSFRGERKAPEIWDAVSGEHRFATEYEETSGHTTLSLEFASCGSCFVIFREPAKNHPATGHPNYLKFESLAEINGPWTVHFDPKWGGPASAQFDQLIGWTNRAELGIKYYSGTAVYEKTFSLPDLDDNSAHPKLFLDLGDLRELAEVDLNGKNLGITWSPPFRLDISSAVQSGENHLKISVVNLWANRIIGDQFLPKEQRRTQTNIRVLTTNTPLMESGLLGPVRILRGE